MQESQENYFGYHPDAELVLGIVCPLGVEHVQVVETIVNYLSQFGYSPNRIRISELFPVLFRQLHQPWDDPPQRAAQADYRMEAGNAIRQLTKQEDILARVAASQIANSRKNRAPLHRTAHIIATLKRPEEVDTLRRIYGTGFFLIGILPSREHRERYFEERGIAPADAAGLIEKDGAESTEYGQQTRETFHLADVFVSTENYRSEISRFLDLVFGRPDITPTSHEHAMFMAYSASLRSGDLSRQVGAAILDGGGDLLSVGCNEVPKFGGGIYGPAGGGSREIEKGYDANEYEKEQMIGRILAALGRDDLDSGTAKRLLKPTGVTDITEFGRSVHAEMEALLACARGGRSVRGASLFTTTFPCHNCCRHIVAAGIQHVYYIEPYAKSKAPTLHGDAISIDETVEGKLPFLPFIGIGPRRYFDLFSMKLSTGYPIERKIDGKLRKWERSGRVSPRLQIQPSTYLDREALAWQSVKQLLRSEERDNGAMIWGRSGENDEAVKRMPEWVKGSPNNEGRG